MVIAITNQKGGVGKTTTAINLAAGLGYLGRRVLIIDIDPQGNCTTGVGLDKTTVQRSMNEVMTRTAPLKTVIIKNVFQNVDLAPALISLASAEVYLVDHQHLADNILKSEIASVLDGYHYVLIDCPPSLGLVNQYVLASVDSILIPLQAEFYAMEGLAQLLECVYRVKTNYNQRLKITGILITMHDVRTNIAKQVRTEVKKYFPEKLFTTVIPRNVRLSEAPSHGETIIQYAPRSSGAKAYVRLAKELMHNDGC